MSDSGVLAGCPLAARSAIHPIEVESDVSIALRGLVCVDTATIRTHAVGPSPMAAGRTAAADGGLGSHGD